uniref:Uncharacterized protein n=1 Tax=Alexandrium catenella TaxID=2925 RepID=A0A7S1WUK1_ALECA
MGAMEAMVAGGPSSVGNPLAVSYPSPMLVLHYPLLATSVRILCEGEQARKQSSFAATLVALRSTYRTEGMVGVYRGAPLYALHTAARDLLKFLADCGLRRCGCLSAALPAKADAEAVSEAPDGERQGKAPGRGAYCMRLAVKYLIDAACYPLLLASTRAILLCDDQTNVWERFCSWREAEGMMSLFGGLASSLVCTAFEEIAEVLLERFIERSTADSEISTVDKLTLKACSSQVASVFTAPFNYVGVIQRCQSQLPGLPRPQPLRGMVLNLPWLSSLYQLVAFSGVLALNVKMMQLKLEYEDFQEEGGEE